MDEMIKIIGNWGFPLALCIYLLTRQEAKLAALTTAIEALNKTLAVILDRVPRP